MMPAMFVNAVYRAEARRDSFDRDSARVGAISRLKTHATNGVYRKRPVRLASTAGTGSAQRSLFYGDRSLGIHGRANYQWPYNKDCNIGSPTRKKGYVLIVPGCDDLPDIYIKLQLGSGFVYGRSFHPSDKP